MVGTLIRTDRVVRVIPRTSILLDQARVVSSEILEVRGVRFDDARTVALPEKAMLASTAYDNCADATVSTTLSLSVSGTSGYSFTKGDSVSATIGGSATLTFVGKSGSFATTLSVSRTVGTSSSTTESYQETTTRSQSVTLTVQGRKQGKFELIALETTIEVPFSATIIVDGSIAPNTNGLLKASQLLGEAERTLPFNGVLRITNVSDSKIRTSEVPGAPACATTENSVRKKYSSISFPAAGLAAQEIATFQRPGLGLPSPLKFKFVDPSHLRGQLQLFLGDGPSIGPADGVSYTVLYTTDDVHPTHECGFNSLVFQKNGVFSIEAREYTSYANGS